jgi:predicted CoA-binding protein
VTETDGALAARLIGGARTIAVVGIASDPTRPSHEVAKYLIEAGFEVYLVNPMEPGPILGRPVYARLQDVPVHIEIVDVFRRPEFVPEVVVDAIEAGAGAVWMQLRIVNEEAAASAVAAGLQVVMDRCTKIEHGRLQAAGRDAPGG